MSNRSHRVVHQGLYEYVDAADDYVLLEPGDDVAAAVGQGIGLLYAVAETGGPYRAVERIWRDGEPLADDEETLEAGEGNLVVWSFEADDELVPGAYTFEVSFPDHAGSEPLVAEVTVRKGAKRAESTAALAAGHVGTYTIDPDDGTLAPHTPGLRVRLDDPKVASFGVTVDLQGGFRDRRLTVVLQVDTPDGTSIVTPYVLTAAKVLAWPAADRGEHVLTLRFPGRPDAEQVYRFIVG